MKIKRNAMGRAEIVGSGEFVGAEPVVNPASVPRFKKTIGLGALMAETVVKQNYPAGTSVVSVSGSGDKSTAVVRLPDGKQEKFYMTYDKGSVVVTNHSALW